MKDSLRPNTSLKQSKLYQLTCDEGYEDILDLLKVAISDSVVPGICIKPSCDYSREIEPDSNSGWCEECEANTVWSCLVLADII